MAIIRTPAYIPPFLDVTETMKECFYAVSCRKSPYLRDEGEAISMRRLEGIPISVPRGFRSLVTETCRRNNFEPVLFSVSASRKATIMFAEMGRAVALLSSGDKIPFFGDAVICRKIEDEEMIARRSVVTMREKNLSAVAEGFLEHVELSDNDKGCAP